jgi:hypothetical protein
VDPVVEATRPGLISPGRKSPFTFSLYRHPAHFPTSGFDNALRPSLQQRCRQAVDVIHPSTNKATTVPPVSSYPLHTVHSDSALAARVLTHEHRPPNPCCLGSIPRGEPNTVGTSKVRADKVRPACTWGGLLRLAYARVPAWETVPGRSPSFRNGPLNQRGAAHLASGDPLAPFGEPWVFLKLIRGRKYGSKTHRSA